MICIELNRELTFRQRFLDQPGRAHGTERHLGLVKYRTAGSLGREIAIHRMLQ